MILSEDTNGEKIKMELWDIQDIFYNEMINNSTNPTLVIKTECLFGRVAVELCDGEEVLNNCRE